jgi:L-ascorbate metabolism protein UlaG (beta-lactamase superfamily)
MWPSPHERSDREPIGRLGVLHLWRSDPRLIGQGTMAEIRWYGHNCFRIRAKEATVIVDPVGRQTGYVLAKQTADVVVISHDHAGHANLNAIKPEFQVVRGPGEYEMHDAFITGIRTYHDAEKGTVHGYNTAYMIELEGMHFCHLGDLGHALTEEQMEVLATCDVLMIPVGGGTVMSVEVAAEMIGQLEPKVVIPMQYATAIGDKSLGGLEPFCKALGVQVPAAEEKLSLRSSELTETMRLVVLNPDSEAARR